MRLRRITGEGPFLGWALMAVIVVICCGESQGVVVAFHGNPWNKQLGACVETGDVNGDGYADVVASAPYADAPGRPWAGAVYIIWGSPDVAQKLANPKDWKDSSLVLVGGKDYSSLGISLAVADLNGDGYDDVAAGSPFAEKGKRGAIYIIYGGSDLGAGTWDFSDREADVVIVGAMNGMNMGKALAAGDVDGDGMADLACTAPGFIVTPNREGCVFLFLGSNLDGRSVWDTEKEPVDVVIHSFRGNKGKTVCPLFADLDGDGLDGLVLGLPESEFGAEIGDGFVVYTDASPEKPMVDIRETGGTWVVEGKNWGKGLGCDLLAHDLDGDGADELILSAFQAKGRKAKSGAIYVVDGGSPPTVMGPLCTGDPLSVLGTSLALGDIDASGEVDLAMGAPGDDAGKKDAGSVYVIWDIGSTISWKKGKADPIGMDLLMTGHQTRANLGMALAIADIDGDKLADLITGAPKAAPKGRQDAGLVSLLLLGEGEAVSLAQQTSQEGPFVSIGQIFAQNPVATAAGMIPVVLLCALAVRYAMRRSQAGDTSKATEMGLQVFYDRSKQIVSAAASSLQPGQRFELQMGAACVGTKVEDAQQRVKDGSEKLAEGDVEALLKFLDRASQIDPRITRSIIGELVLEDQTRIRIEADARRGTLIVRCWPGPGAVTPDKVFLVPNDPSQSERSGTLERIPDEVYLLAEFEDLPSGQFKVKV